jgi:hypothetical protein
MNLSADEINQNWETYRTKVNTLFASRKDELNKMYDEFENRMALMPASSMAHYHNAFAGGYVAHILNVMRCAEAQYNMWTAADADMSGYTFEELMFAAMHHDLGKVGFPGDGNEAYQVETSDWHRKKMGRLYKPNENIPFSTVPDRSIYLLHTYNVNMSWNEYQAIKIHDGVYDDANKPYFMARTAKAKLKTNLPIILHHADHMAAQIEYENWRNIDNETPKVSAPKSKETKMTAVKNLAESDPNAGRNIADIFSSFGD